MHQRIDTTALKRAHPIAEVVGGYGIALCPSGRALVGRCPFHADSGRPNLYVYPASESWYCFRCAIGGDAISFVERIEGVGFRRAVARLAGEPRADGYAPTRVVRALPPPFARRSRPPAVRGPAERACLAAAVDLYQNRLLTDPIALRYVESRGIDRATIERCRVGYAAGDELAAYLRWRRLPSPAAMRVGLLGRDGCERMAGRVVVPEIRAGQPIWLVGRALQADRCGPKYLGLPGRKPLLGWEAASGARAVYLVEGVFDWLALRSWGLPALALVGTHARPEAIKALGRFERIYLALDGDEAGRVAAAGLMQALGGRATMVALPEVKDVAELAPSRDGRGIFARAVRESELALAA